MNAFSSNKSSDCEIFDPNLFFLPNFKVEVVSTAGRHFLSFVSFEFPKLESHFRESTQCHFESLGPEFHQTPFLFSVSPK